MPGPRRRPPDDGSAFYLDLSHGPPTIVPLGSGAGALPDPGRGRRGVKEEARPAQVPVIRTRERLPVMPALAPRSPRPARRDRRLRAAQLPSRRTFTAEGQTLRRAITSHAPVGNIWAEDPDSGTRRDLSREEHRAFWAWAAVEVLRHTGVRIEELTEFRITA